MAGNTVQIKFEAVSNFNNVINNVKQIQTALRGIRLPDKVGDRLEKNINGVVTSIEKLQQKSKQGFSKPGDVSAYEKELQKVDTMLHKVVKDLGSLSGKDLLKLNIDTTKIIELKRQVSEAKKEMASSVKGAMFDSGNLKGAFAGMDQILNKGSKTRAIYEQLVSAINKGNFSKAESEWAKLEQYMTRYNSTKINSSQWTDMQKVMTAAIAAGETEIQKFLPLLDRLDKEVKEATTAESGNINAVLGDAQGTAAKTADQFDRLAQSERNAANEMLSMNQQMSQLKTQANYFFSLQNMFQLLKRGIQDAFQTVKDLDKAMTETAVVTDFSVGDMWKALPEYTKLANELGATTQGAYETMTLYYQQGLNKEQAFGLGEETMKMARIAGLDYAETTNMMTAALRGFNMELDNTSAKRINDVYSQLAAKTASDTYELGSAMERTASIAHSANMSFESTTAFLAQMIETTREAPENLGTAMKTIVARFQELKENPYEISEVEGEEVNYNRIDKALKTIGVTLVDNKDKFRDLDDVFMDISERWDSLSQTQQRYIATIAAGSRQQSRFIAMVGNYQRVSELTEAANNAAGASNVQFAKTLDSIEAKLNKLKNAWDQFLMGITNSGFLKGAVDIGTDFITVINKIINKISGGNGLIKSVLSLGAAFAGLKLGGKLVNIGLGGVANFIDPKRKGSFMSGLSGRRDATTSIQGEAISKPIVGVLDRIYSLLANWSQKSATNQSESQRLGFKEYGALGRDFRNMFSRGAATVRSVTDKLNGLDANQQKSLMSSIPNLGTNLRQQFMSQFSNLNLGPEGQKALKSFWVGMMADVKTGATTWEQVLKTAFHPEEVGSLIGGKTGDAIQAAVTQASQKVKTPFGNINYSDTFELDKAQGDAIRKAYFSEIDKAFNGKDPGSLNARINMPLPKINGFEKVGGKISNAMGIAGQAVTSFGMVVDKIIPGAGATFMQLGNIISMVGTTIGSVIGKLPQIGKFLLSPIGAAVMAIGAVIGTIAIFANKHRKAIEQIQKDGKKVIDTYKKETDAAEKNLHSLNEYRENYAKLVNGVDENGYNVSLGTQEYSDYKKMVNDLVKMNPSIIKGYNAEGQAIIDKNKALEETIKLQQQNKKAAVENFTSEQSLQKLIDRRNTLKRYTRNIGTGFQGSESAKTEEVKIFAGGKAAQQIKELEKVTYKSGAIGTGNARQSYYQDYVDLVLKTAKEAGGDAQEKVKEALKEYQINTDKIDEASLRIFDSNAANIEQTINSILSNASVDSDAITDVSEKLAKASKESGKFKEGYADTLEGLQVYASQFQQYKDLDEQWQGTYIQSLDAIASRADLSAKEMMDQAKQLATRMGDASNNIQQALGDGITEAQEQYLIDLDEAGYTEAVSDEVSELESLYSEAEAIYENHKTAENQIIAEMYKNELDSIRNFTTDSGALLEEQFNTLKSRIEGVNKLFETYQSRIEGGDYYTGADNLSQIMEDINSDKNKAGKGSQSWWIGTEMLVGEENVQEKGRKELKADLQDINGMLQEGQKGADKFMQHLYKKQPKTLPEEIFGQAGVTLSDYIKVDENGYDFSNFTNVTTEQFDAIAKALDMSSDTLTAMLNKARQFYNINFTDQAGIREALAGSDSTIEGTKSTSFNGEDYKNLYTLESNFDAEARAQGVLPKELKSLKKDLQKKGVKLMPSADSITNKDLKGYIQDWSIVDDKGKTTSEELIASLSQIGYNKEDIKSIWEGAEGNLIKDAEEIDFNKVYDSVQEGLENPQIKGINDNTVGILNNTDAILMAMGVLSENSKNNADQIYQNAVGEKGINDTRIQAFGEGYTQDGRVINDYDAFTRNREVLMTEAQGIVDQIKQYREGREQAVEKYGEDSQQVANWDKAIGKLESALKVYQANINEGDDKFFSMIEALKLKDTSPDRAQSQSRELSDYYKKTYTDQNGNLDLNALQQQGINFASVNQDMLKNLSSDQLTRILQQWKLTKTQIDAIRTELGTKWNQKGLESTAKKLTEIENKNKKIFNKSQKQIRYDIITNTGSGAVGNKGSDKAMALIQEATKGKTVTQKKIIYQAIVKQANGDKKGAQELIEQNFDGKEEKQVKKDVKIITNPKVANKKELKTALNNEVESVTKNFKKKKKTDFKLSVGVKKIKTANLKNFKELYDKVDKYKSKRLSISTNTKDANGDLKGIIDKQNKIDKKKRQKITVTAGGNGAAGLQNIIDKLETIQGTYTATVTVKRKKGGGGGGNKDGEGGENWLGSNNIIKASPIPILPSYAEGKLGPKGKGGMTLTGEKGYEIAWIPSQNKSMILGTQGPQMIDLPKDATVWNHEQSKKIMKQKSIPLGSLAGGITISGSGTWNSSDMRNFFNQVAQSVQVSSGSSIKSKTKTKTKSKKSGSGRTITKELKKTGKISVKIYNIEKKIEATQQKIDLLQEKINKQLEKTSITLGGISKNNSKQIKYYTQLLKLNQQLYTSAKNRLKALDKSAKASKTEIKWSNKAKKTKIDSKGKRTTSKTTVSHTADISLSRYIKRDPVTGAYQINQSALDRVSKKDRNKAKAIRDAAKKEIDENTSKKNSAEKAISDANKAIEDIAQKLYETFYGWENELTKILDLTTKITKAEKARERASSIRDLRDSMLESGMQKASSDFLKKSFEIFRRQAALQLKEIELREKKISETRKKITEHLGRQDEKEEINRINKRLQQGKKANKATAKYNKATSTVSTYNKNRKKAKKAIADAKTQRKRINNAEKILNNKKSSKKEKERAKKTLKDAKKKLARDKKIYRANSTAALSAGKNNKRLRKMEKLNLSPKREKTYRKRIKELEKKQKKKGLSKSERKELNNKKAALRRDAKAEKWLKAYRAKQNKADLLRRKKAAGKTLSVTERMALEKYRSELQEERKNIKTAQKYIKTIRNADGTVSISINQDRLEKDKREGKISEKLYNFIKDYYDKAVELDNDLQEDYSKQLETLNNLYTDLRELKNAYAERSEELLDAVVDDAEKNIEKLEKLNDALTNALKDLLDEVKKRLDQRRQQEDNLKTEQEIASKQQRLAALRADNAGGNAKAIKQLEKEIAEAQLNYERSLEDQALDRLQDQADEAQKQRERQIKLLQDQLEVSKTNGELLAMVNALLLNPGANKEQIQGLWRQAQDYYNKTDARRQTLDADWNKFWSDIQIDTGLPAEIAHQEEVIKDATNTLNNTLESIDRTLAAMAGDSANYWINRRKNNTVNTGFGTNGGKTTSVGRLAQKDAANAGGSYNIKDWVNDAKAAGLSDSQIREGMAGMETSKITGTYKGKEVSTSAGHVNASGTKIAAAVQDKVYYQTLNADGTRGAITGYSDVNAIKDEEVIKNNLIEFKQAYNWAITHQKPGSKYPGLTKAIIEKFGWAGKTFKLTNGRTGTIGQDGILYYDTNKGNVNKWNLKEGKDKVDTYNRKRYEDHAKKYTYVGQEYEQAISTRKKLKKYAAGGLATTTGPAWLDGTKSKPELVLDAQDTSNFLALKDVLAKVISGSKSINNTNNANYDINIHVDQLANDYDVDKMVERVKKQITKDAGYRNVNTVRHMR